MNTTDFRLQFNTRRSHARPSKFVSGSLTGPIFACTRAYPTERDETTEVRALELGAWDFLPWTFVIGHLPADIDHVLQAGVAHLWFVTIHPFDDGNGRIARAIADLCLARSEKSSQRFYSMSAQIRMKRKAYYDILENTQKGGTDITPWLAWFLECLGGAIDGAGKLLAGILAKARFWQKLDSVELNQRQRVVLNRLLDGFEGKLTTTKWAKLTKASQDTATRDIHELIEKGILQRSPGRGRSTSYNLVLE